MKQTITFSTNPSYLSYFISLSLYKYCALCTFLPLR